MIPLSNIINEISTCSLIEMTLFSTGLIVVVIMWMGTKKNWTCKGMIYKLVPPPSGLISLVVATSCTTHGVVGVLLLVPISTYTKLSDLYWKSGKAIWYAHSSNW